MLNLKNKAQSINESGIPFMEEREKAELITDEILTIDDFGFIKSDEGDYVVLSCLDYPKFFFFGGSVVTAKFKQLIEGEDLKAIKAELEQNGLPTIFSKQKAKKNNREYMTCEFYPEVKA